MRILVIRPGALGDVLLTLPALQALQAGWPQAQTDLMGDLPVVEWLPGRSVVRAASAFERADLAALFQSETVPTEALRRFLDQFDVILSYATPPEHIFARNLTGVATGRVLSVDARPRPDVGMHTSDYLQLPLQELGVSASACPPRLWLTALDEQQGAQWWARRGLSDTRILCLHPGSGSLAKNWPAERFAEVAHWAQREPGLQVVLISGPADESAVRGVRRRLDGLGHWVLHRPPLPLLAAILTCCQVYLGNDSGVSHLAAALGVPTVAIFGPTDPGVWAPRGQSVHIVRGSAPCAPCSPGERRECARNRCLEAVSADAVIDVLRSVLSAA
jgi:ADP-heptose:LPS heptosyltransferase